MAILVFLFLIFIFNLIYFFKIKSISNSKLKLDYYREIPSNESPAIVGYMIKGNCDGNDVVATLLDLNYRGYINIQYELIDGVEKSVISLTDKDRFMVLKDFENFLLDELFKNNEKVILDDYFSSHQFQEIFNPFGNMIKKRVELQSTHKISTKKNISKISFITHFVSLGFSISFPLLFLILRKSIDVIYIIGISFIINFCFFYIYKLLVDKSRYKLDQYLINYSYISLVLFIGIIIILYMINNIILINSEPYIMILNILSSMLLTISLFKPFIKTNKNYEFLDYYFIILGFVSTIFLDIIGICLSSLYLSLKIYILSPNHINLRPETEIEKWIALKQFLNDFSIINERGEKEVNLWEKYLIYAIAMGVNKKCILKYSDLLKLKLINDNVLSKFYIEKIDY